MVRYIRMSGLIVLAIAVTIAPVAPVYAQAGQQQQQQTGQSSSQDQQQTQQQNQQNQVTAQNPEIVIQQPGPPPPPAQPKAFSDKGMGEYSYGKRFFPTVLAPYTQLNVPMPNLVNTADLDTFIKDGKLVISLQDAISLALKNNLDIQVQQFNPWIAETAILRGRAIGAVTSFDPTYTLVTGVNITNSPVVNPLISGTGTSGGLSAVASRSFFVQDTYTQNFSTGTTFQATLNGTRSASSASANIFNPSVTTTANVTLAQQLLRGFGKTYNDRPLYIAQNNKLISDATFKQSVLADITAVEIDYWELVYARQNVAVGQQVLATAQKLLSDDQKQVEIGTLAPLDVTSAEAGVASAQQQLVQDQTVLRQDELVLLSVITKNPIAQNLTNIEVVPTDNMFIPEETEKIPLDQAVKEAIANRPDYQEFALALRGDDINIRAAKNELLPLLQISGNYGWTGLAGRQTVQGAVIPGTFTADLNEPIVNSSGQVVANEFISVPVTQASTVNSTGLTTAFNDIFQNKFPNYGATLTFQLPIRNRSAQADSIQSILTQRQDLVKLQAETNTVVVDVRGTQITLEQDRASLTAAQATVKYAQDAVDAEEKKLQFGTSTTFAVVQLQQNLAQDAAALVRAEVNLVEAKVQFDRAMARTFAVNNVNIQTAQNQPASNPLIPGTMKNGQLYASPFMSLQPTATSADSQAAPAQPASSTTTQPGTLAPPKNHE